MPLVTTRKRREKGKERGEREDGRRHGTTRPAAPPPAPARAQTEARTCVASSRAAARAASEKRGPGSLSRNSSWPGQKPAERAQGRRQAGGGNACESATQGAVQEGALPREAGEWRPGGPRAASSRPMGNATGAKNERSVEGEVVLVEVRSVSARGLGQTSNRRRAYVIHGGTRREEKKCTPPTCPSYPAIPTPFDPVPPRRPRTRRHAPKASAARRKT